MENKTYDLAIIGGGPGGYVAAIRAAQLGKKVLLVEKERLGGICLNWGCIPAKAMLKSSELYSYVKKSAEYGIEIGKTDFDLKKIVKRSREISKKLSDGIDILMKKNKIEVVYGHAKIASPRSLEIESSGRKSFVKVGNIIIASGARARVLKGFEPDGKYIWTYKEAMVPESLPKSLIIVGSGAIGIEFASFYNEFGTEVTIIEAHERILNVEDPEVSKAALKIFSSKGIKFHNETKLLGQKKKDGFIEAEFEINGKKTILKAEKLLMAVGVVGNVENIGLENTKIKIEGSRIATDKFCETGEPGIYAIGDVATGPGLAHKASREGVIAAERIAGLEPHPIDPEKIPSGVYSNPQIASIGISEEEAKKSGRKINIGRFPFLANGKSLILGEKEGFVKTIFDSETGELLGAHAIGSDVTESIHALAAAKYLEATDLDLIDTIFAHPTLSEAFVESVMDSKKIAIHI